MKRDKKKSLAFKQGMSCFKSDGEMDENPYPLDSKRGHDFDGGYLTALYDQFFKECDEHE